MSASGLIVCAAQLYGPARVFRVGSGRAELLFETAPFFAQTLALRVAGGLLFVAGQNKEVRVYDLGAGRLVQTLGRDREGGCGILEISAYSQAEWGPRSSASENVANSAAQASSGQKLGPGPEVTLALLGELGRHVLVRLSACGEARLCENQLLGVATERGPTRAIFLSAETMVLARGKSQILLDSQLRNRAAAVEGGSEVRALARVSDVEWCAGGDENELRFICCPGNFVFGNPDLFGREILRDLES